VTAHSRIVCSCEGVSGSKETKLQVLEALPIGIVVFPGSGVTDNLADKARRFGIPLFDFRNGGA
jgi:hypothetical protein